MRNLRPEMRNLRNRFHRSKMETHKPMFSGGKYGNYMKSHRLSVQRLRRLRKWLAAAPGAGAAVTDVTECKPYFLFTLRTHVERHPWLRERRRLRRRPGVGRRTRPGAREPAENARVTPNDALGGGVSRLVVTLSPDLEGRVVAKASGPQRGHHAERRRSLRAPRCRSACGGSRTIPRRSFRRRDGRHSQRATDSELEARR